MEETLHLIREPIWQSAMRAATYLFPGVTISEKVALASVPRLTNSHELCCVTGASNPSYQGIITIGADESQVADVVGGGDAMMLLDALGELANNICAEMNSESIFVNACGILTQSPPVFSNRGEVFFPKVTGLQGYFSVGSCNTLFGFAIRNATF